MVSRAAKLAILVAALGYFVDIYDLILFTMVRKTSLLGLGSCAGLDHASQACEAILTDKGVFLINMQMGGMMRTSRTGSCTRSTSSAWRR